MLKILLKWIWLYIYLDDIKIFYPAIETFKNGAED